MHGSYSWWDPSGRILWACSNHAERMWDMRWSGLELEPFVPVPSICYMNCMHACMHVHNGYDIDPVRVACMLALLAHFLASLRISSQSSHHRDIRLLGGAQKWLQRIELCMSACANNPVSTVLQCMKPCDIQWNRPSVIADSIPCTNCFYYLTSVLACNPE